MADDPQHCFDDEGDVILNVGRENPHQLRVSSKNLMCASPVFRALLGPHFREGQAKRCSQNPAKIDLPEDDGHVMALVCEQLHPSERGPSPQGSIMDAKAILGYAVLVDKYGLVGALRLQAEGMLLSWLHRKTAGFTSNESRIELVAATYLLKQSHAFEVATRKVIVEGRMVDPYVHKSPWSFLPIRVIVALTERMTMASCGKLDAAYAKKGLCLGCVNEGLQLRVGHFCKH